MAEEASKLRGLEARVAALREQSLTFLLQFIRRLTEREEEKKKAMISKRQKEIYPALSLSKAAQTLPTPRRPAFHIPRPSRTEPRQFQPLPIPVPQLYTLLVKKKMITPVRPKDAYRTTTQRLQQRPDLRVPSRRKKSDEVDITSTKIPWEPLFHELKKRGLLTVPRAPKESTEAGTCQYHPGAQDHNLQGCEEFKKEVATLMRRTNFQARMERIKEDFEEFCEKKKEELGKLTPATPPEMSKPDPVVIQYATKEKVMLQTASVSTVQSSEKVPSVVIQVPQPFPYHDNKREEEVVGNLTSGLGGITRSGRCYTPEELEKRRKEIGKTAEDPVKTKVAEDEAADFLRIIKSSEYSVVKQLEQDALPYISTGTVTRIRVSQESSTEGERPCIKALYISVKTNDRIVSRVLIDNGSALNVCPLSTLEKLDIDPTRVRVTSMVVRAFDGTRREVLGEIDLPVEVGLQVYNINFQGNKDRYGLGYTPTRKDRQIAYEARRQRAAAKLRGEKWPEKKMVIPHIRTTFPASAMFQVDEGDVDELALLFAEDLNVNATTVEGDFHSIRPDQYEEVDLEGLLDEEDLKGYRIEEETCDEDTGEDADLPDLLLHLMISRGLETLEFEIHHHQAPSNNNTTTIAEEEYAGPMVEGLSIHTITKEEDSTTHHRPATANREKKPRCGPVCHCYSVSQVAMSKRYPSYWITRKTSNDPHVSEIDNKTNCSLDNIDNSDEEIELPNDILEALERQDEGSKPNIEELEIINLADEGEEPREVKIGTRCTTEQKEALIALLKRVPRDLRLQRMPCSRLWTDSQGTIRSKWPKKTNPRLLSSHIGEPSCIRCHAFRSERTQEPLISEPWSLLFHDMIHHEIEVYVDDMIAKSRTAQDHLTDLRKLFQRLKKYQLRLNPNKCAFGVTSGKLLGFIVSGRGIEIDPAKTAREPFDKIKEYLLNPPILVPPTPGRPLILYLTVQEASMGCMLGQQDETGKKEQAIYYLSKKFTEPETRYLLVEKTCCALAWASKKLRQYMLYYTTWLVSRMDPIKYIFEKPAFDWEDCTSTKIIMAGGSFTLMEQQTLSEAGLAQSWYRQRDNKLPIAVKLGFDCTNNMTEYEACIVGLQAALEFGAYELEVFGDSLLIVSQTNGEWQARDPKLIPYQRYISRLVPKFKYVTFTYTPRAHNHFADALATLASLIKLVEGDDVRPLRIETRDIPAYCVCVEECMNVAIDYFTKWVEACSFKNVTQVAVTRFVKNNIICRYGMPEMLITDNASNLNNRMMDQLCQQFKIQHPQLCSIPPKDERSRRSCQQKREEDSEQDDGDIKIGTSTCLTLCVPTGTSVRTSVGATPYSLVYGMEAVLPVEVEIPSLRILSQTQLEEAEWAQARYEQLNFIDEKRLAALCPRTALPEAD
uniref:Integrase catalytic domain-containing protein n=1 Tax=Fagus sylvatica TaxID=28930 RepID=A0A2N9G9T8_FAGSY